MICVIIDSFIYSNNRQTKVESRSTAGLGVLFSLVCFTILFVVCRMVRSL